jgi:hypothetical protein
MQVRIQWGRVVAGLLGVVAACAGAAIYVWIVSFPLGADGHRDGQQILLIAFAPLVAVGILVLVGKSLQHAWRGLTLYDINADSITLRTPLGSHTIQRSDVRDYSLAPGSFPDPPRQLLLDLSPPPQRIALPLELLRKAGAEPALVRCFPFLGEGAIDRVRTASDAVAPSSLRVRWALNRSALAMLYGGLIMLLLFAGGGLVMSWEFFNYLRITRSHRTATAQVTEIIEDRSSRNHTVHARVEYLASNGQGVRLRREVAPSFMFRFKVGDHVTVDYLPDHPRIGRIRDWDIDGRQWVLLVVSLPLIVLAGQVTRKSAADWFRPLREEFQWRASGAPASVVSVTDAALDTLHAVVPERHVGGAMVIFPRSKGHGEGFLVWQRRLRHADIEAKAVAGTFLALSSADATRMVARIGDGFDLRCDYFVLDYQSADDAERFALEWLIDNRIRTIVTDADAMSHVKIFLLKGVAGPFDAGTSAEVFERWIERRLRKLYGGASPPATPAVRFAELLGVDPAAGTYSLLIERRRTGPRVWLHVAKQPTAMLAECQRGRWVMNPGQPLPAPLRQRRSVLTTIVFLPFLALVGLVTLLCWPLLRWASRQRANQLARAAIAARATR